ncbi:hypothetical protein Tco_1404228 [Tanacetum coccineum]
MWRGSVIIGVTGGIVLLWWLTGGDGGLLDVDVVTMVVRSLEVAEVARTKVKIEKNDQGPNVYKLQSVSDTINTKRMEFIPLILLLLLFSRMQGKRESSQLGCLVWYRANPLEFAIGFN